MQLADATQAAVESHKASLIMLDNFHFELVFVLIRVRVVDAFGSQFVGYFKLTVLFDSDSLPKLPIHYLLVRKKAAIATLVH